MNRFVSMVTTSAIATLALSSAPSALACGDKLTVLGGGIPFDKIHTSHRHGSLIMYLSPGLAPVGDQQRRAAGPGAHA